MENQQRRLLFGAVGLSRSDREFLYYIGGSEPAVVFGTIMIDRYLIQNSRVGWHFILNRLLTKDQLYQSENFQDDRNRICVLCFSNDNYLNHLLFSCLIPLKIWDNVII